MTSYVNFAGAPVSLGSSNVAPAISASSAGQEVDGTSGNDLLGDINGGATLVGGAGDDSYVIVDSRTQIIEQPGGGVDTVTAYNNYVMPANVEVMKLGNVGITGVANNAGDTMIITGSHDTLDSGAGSDVLVDSGTGGANIFSFTSGGGHDDIYGFKAGDGATHDTLRLGDYGITSFSQLQGMMSQVGADTLIHLSSTDAILLRGVTVSSLTANDFMLQIDTSHLTPTFNEDFDSLSLYSPGTGQGIWKTNYFFGAQSGAWAYNSREMNSADQSLAVDPSFSGTGTTPLGLNPFSISNGVLSINTEKTPAADVAALSGYQYTTGVLTTENSFSQTYGYFEIKTELPAQQGMWPAFWLLPKNGGNPPELDVMEYMGGSQTLQTVHTSTDGGSATGFSTYSPDATTGFHTYGVLWTPTTLTWYMDGVAIHTTATPADMNQPMYMLVSGGLSTEVNGGAAANFNGASMLVDYVHAYSLAEVDAAGGVTGVDSGETSSSTPAGGDTSGTGDTSTSTSTSTGGDTSGTGDTSTSASTSTSTSTSTGGDTSTSSPASGGGTSAHAASGSSDSSASSTGSTTSPAGTDTTDLTLHASGGALDGGSASDTIVGDTSAITVRGMAGDDSIMGGSGGDDLNGNTGADTVHGGGGSDTVMGGQDNDQVFGDAGNDLVNGNKGEDTVHGGQGDDTIYGGQGNDMVYGDLGNDVMSGDLGNDSLYAGPGNETLAGGHGADLFVFTQGVGQDVVSDFNSAEGDRIQLAPGAAYTIVAVGSNTEIDLSAGGHITLLGVTPAHLGDWLLVA